MRPLSFSPLIIGLFSLSSCRTVESGSNVKIAGGRAPASSDPAAETVAKVKGLGPSSSVKGTGVLIHERAILTAWHVAKKTTNQISIGDSYFEVSNPDDIVFHPTARIIGQGNSQVSQDDLAILILPRAVPNVEPAAVISPRSQYQLSTGSTSRSRTKGTSMRTYGFGDTEEGATDYGRLNMVDVRPIAESSSQKIIRLFSGTIGTGPLPGDSGGPTFVTINGKPVVTAISAFGSATTSTFGGVDLRLYSGWIQSVLRAHGLALRPTVALLADNQTQPSNDDDDTTLPDESDDDGNSSGRRPASGDTPRNVPPRPLPSSGNRGNSTSFDLTDLTYYNPPSRVRIRFSNDSVGYSSPTGWPGGHWAYTRSGAQIDVDLDTEHHIYRLSPDGRTLTDRTGVVYTCTNCGD